MNALNNLMLGRRLALAFGATIAVFLAVAAVALYSSARQGEADELNVHTYKVLAAGEDMLKGMVNMETGTRGFALAGEDKFLVPWQNGQTGFDQALSQAKQLTADNPAQQKRLQDMQAQQAAFKELAQSMQQFRRDVEGGKKAMPDLIAEFKAGKDKVAMDAFRALNADFVKAEQDLLVVRSADAAALRAFNRNAVIGGSLGALIMAVVVGMWITRSITAPIHEAVALAGRVAKGDLSSRIAVTRRDEVGQLLSALQEMNDGLVDVVSRVRNSSENIATGSSEIATGNADLSQRTEEQASNLQQTAASMEQLSSTVKQNADTSRQATALAGSASEAASKGGEVVGQVVSTMEAITASSKKISDIISVIDGIAFQTNILALNAAVEAARAGEQGRGFAVVASEVRSLAQRSAAAAREIKTLIGDSVEKVETGSKLVGDAGRSMDDIVNQVRRVSDLINEISSATCEQTSGIDQVSHAVTQLDHVTQQNAALVEQSAAAADSLKSQAAHLVAAVSIFKLS